MNPRIELEVRYPEADFSVYFRFLDACRGTEKGLDTQEHHICPRKQFPEFISFPENLITLRVVDHAHAHKLLGAAVPELKRTRPDWLLAMAKVQRESAAKGGRVMGLRHVLHGTGLFGRSAEKKREDAANAGRCNTREHFQEMGRKGGVTAARLNQENNRAIFAPGACARGGYTQSRKQKESNTGFYGLTLEQRRAAGRLGGLATGFINAHKRWHVKRNFSALSCKLCNPLL